MRLLLCACLWCLAARVLVIFYCTKLGLRWTEQAKVLRDAVAIVLDEATMGHKHLFGVVDRLLQDIMCTEELFGGKLVVLAGDWRQLTPVVVRGGRAEAKFFLHRSKNGLGYNCGGNTEEVCAVVRVSGAEVDDEHACPPSWPW